MNFLDMQMEKPVADTVSMYRTWAAKTPLDARILYRGQSEQIHAGSYRPAKVIIRSRGKHYRRDLMTGTRH